MHYITHPVEAHSPQHSVFNDIHLGCDFASICDVFCSSNFLNLCKHKVKYVQKVWFVQSHVAQLQRKWSVDYSVCLMEEPPGTIMQVQQGKSAVQGRKKTPEQTDLKLNFTFCEGAVTAACMPG